MTTDRSLAIAQAYTQGDSIIAIREQFQCATTTIDRALKKHNVPRRREQLNDWSKELDAKLTRLWLAGTLSAREIAIEMGMTKGAIIGRVHRLELSRPEGVKPVRAKALPRPKPAKVKAKPGPKPKPRPTPSAGPTLPPPVPDISGIVVGSLAQPWAVRTARQCNWPIAGEGADTVYCCGPVVAGSWCEEHNRRGRKDWNGRGAYAEPQQYVQRVARLSRY